MSDNITITGNIAGEVRYLQTTAGVPITTFRVASPQRRYDRAAEKWIDGEPNWFTVSAYRNLAMNAYASLQRGQRVVVTGRLKLRRWENGDRQGTAVEIDAESLGHDLLWGTSTFHRTAQPQAQTEVGDGDPGAESAAPGEAGWHAPSHSSADASEADRRSAAIRASFAEKEPQPGPHSTAVDEWGAAPVPF